MATITKRGNSYRIRVSCGYDCDGKQMVSSMTWKPDPTLTKKEIENEVQRVAADFEANLKGKRIILPAEMLLQDFCKQYLSLVKHKLSPTTYHSYELAIDNYIVPALGHVPLNQLKPLHIQLFVNQLCRPGARADGKKEAIAPTTLRRNYSVLRSILAKAYKLDIIKSNPANGEKIDLPPLGITKTDIFTKEEYIQILNLLQEEPLMYQVLIQLAFVTGCRRGELVALKWDDIDFKQNTVTINKSNYQITGNSVQTKLPKTKGSIRTIALSSSIMPLLESYKQQQQEKLKMYSITDYENWLFTQWNGSAINPSTPTHWFSKFLKKNNIAHRKFHAIRHTSATLLLSSGTDIKTVSSRLGHEDITITNRYLHMVKESDIAAAKTFDNIIENQN